MKMNACNQSLSLIAVFRIAFKRCLQSFQTPAAPMSFWGQLRDQGAICVYSKDTSELEEVTETRNKKPDDQPILSRAK
jgi:hypothetical protein